MRAAEIAAAMGAGIAELLFPSRCLVCDALAPPFCDACAADIRPDPGPEPIDGIEASLCAGMHETTLRDAVLRLKYERKTALAAPLGRLLADRLAESGWPVDFLVPVPIHWTRCLQRGFNQAELLAETAARRAGLPALCLLRRTRATPPQVGLPRSERERNLAGAIAVRQKALVRGRSLLLIDDVRTTGATLAACALALRAEGAAAVYAATVTRDAPWAAPPRPLPRAGGGPHVA